MKPRVGFFGMTSCKGCYFQLLLAGEKLKDLFGGIEVASFWMLTKEDTKGKYDVAFIDGAVSNEENLELVKRLRRNSRFVIAYGTCACLGGIPALRNVDAGKHNAYHMMVYGKKVKMKSFAEATAVEKHIKVDYRMFGCPINEKEALSVVRDLLLGKRPREADYPVCVDCKKAGTRCLFKDGIPCMAPHPAGRAACDGCRGPLPDANWSSEAKLLQEHGIGRKEIEEMFSKYNGGKVEK